MKPALVPDTLSGPVLQHSGTRRKQLPGLNVILTRVGPGGAQVHGQGRLCRPWIKGWISLSATPHPERRSVVVGVG